METKEDIVIVGGGIAGLCVALSLHRLGLRALVLESYDSLRWTGAAFTAWSNAWKVLDALGVGDSLRRGNARFSGVVATSSESGLKTAVVPCGEVEVRCVIRKELIETLAKELPSNAIRFSSKLVNIEKSGYFKLLHLADGSIIKTKVVIGCDGVNSVVARFLGFKEPSFSTRLAIRGIVDFKENHGLKLEFLQFMGHGNRYGILPADPKRVYWFFSWPPSSEDKEIRSSPVKMKQHVLSNLGIVQDKFRAIIEKTKLEDIICSPLRFRLPWDIMWGDITKDNICVAGDALHSMTPDLGQGACSALEDGIVLARCLAEGFSAKSNIESEDSEFRNIETSLEKYAKERKWRVIDLVTTSYLVGAVQSSSWKFMGFLRDNVLATFLARLLFKKAEFDCGQLKIS